MRPVRSARRAWIFALSAAAIAGAPPGGDEPGVGAIEIRSFAGVSVKVDGKFRGVIEEDGVLIVRDVAPGAHRLHAWRGGFEDQYSLAMVEGGLLAVERLRPWQPLVEAGREISTGTLVIETVPARATVESSRLGWKKIALDEQPFVSRHMPAGLHKLTFCNPEKCIDYRAQLGAGESLELMIDFAPGQVRNVTTQRRAQSLSWTEACTRPERGDCLACLRACRRALALEPEKISRACDALGSESGAPDVSDPTAGPSAMQEIASSSRVPPCVLLAGRPPGYVTIRTDPPAELYVGADRLGETPLARVKLPAGCVELRAINREKGVDKKVRVDVEPDEVTIYRFEL